MDPHSDEAALHRATHAAPLDETPHLVLADYYDDNNEPEKAAAHRIMGGRSANEVMNGPGVFDRSKAAVYLSHVLHDYAEKPHAALAKAGHPEEWGLWHRVRDRIETGARVNHRDRTHATADYGHRRAAEFHEPLPGGALSRDPEAEALFARSAALNRQASEAHYHAGNWLRRQGEV
jgi:uncharacterized protein (TIGR02996 family)